MKLKKGILLIALTLIIASVISTFTNVKAAVGSRTISIRALRKSGYGYQFVNNSTEYIWKLYDVNNDVNETFYCMKGGVGFGTDGTGTGGTILPVNYTKSFNLKDPASISDKYKAVLIDPTTKDFERLIWVLDQCYIQPTTNASDAEKNVAKKNKEELLEEVEKYANSFGDIYENTSWVNNKLTDNLKDDDIDALQQLAVWYYTNKGDQFHVESNPAIRINSVQNVDGGYKTFNINDDEEYARVNAINAFYDYLTKKPQEANFSYDYKSTTSTSKPVQFANTTIKFDTSGTRIIIGPYKIEKLRDAEYTLKATYIDGNGSEITDVKLLDKNKADVAEGTTLEDLVGSEFYISASPTTNITNFNLKISGNLFITETTYWNVDNPTKFDQPIVELHKNMVEFEENKAAGKQPEVGKFDLALRKFITSVAGVELTGEDSRVPKISNETLNNLANGGILTLQKVHSKTPIAVNKGDKIVYTIRVYNEGEVDGWATEVTDYLPAGLKFVPKTESTINNQYGWELEAGTNKVTTNYLASEAHKLTAFNKETLALDYEDLQIECEVIANTQKNDQTLKNIAEITANKDIHGNTSPDLDNDSEVKNVTTDPSKYNPQDVQNGLGEQDDDDFEDLVLKGQYFDLALRKFITSVAGVELTGPDSRIPQIGNDTLKNLASGGVLTTKKTHTKTPVAVKKGDRVVYTIRIYNEGQIDGWATEVTDYLPAGLKFIPKTESTINSQYGWELEAGTNKVTTNYLADEAHKLTAFNKETLALDYEDLQIECEVIANAQKSDTILKNIAEITSNKDINGNTDIDLDRDSVVKNVTTDPTKYNPQDAENGLGEQDDDDFEDLLLKGLHFDLALRKFITSVAGVELTGPNSRVPQIGNDTLKNLANGGTLTTKKTHTKIPVAVNKGDRVIYTIRIYNEGEVDGWATEVTDYLPAGLKFVPKTESTINATYGWNLVSGTNKVTTNYLADETHKLTAFNKETLALDYEDLQIECEVIASIKEDDQILKNIAEITANKDINGNTDIDLDRDSVVKNVTTDPTKYNPKDAENGLGEQDDDDFEDLLLKGKYFDLALRKFIVSVTNPNKQAPTIIDSREPVVDVTPLQSGNKTAIYKHTKDPVSVTNGDIVTYTIRVYNEGQIDGYVKKITDHLPEQLEFILTDELNAKYGWKIDPEDPRAITTDITSPETTHYANRDTIYASRDTGSDTDKVLLKAFDGTNLDYIDVQIRCRVKDDIDLNKKITNIAEITEYSNEDNIIDRDSTQDSLTNDNSKPKDDIQNDNLPEDADLPEYKGNTTNKADLSDKNYFYKGQQDDDDFEKLVLHRFDLALRKFITGVVKGENTTEIKNRAPIFKKVSNIEYKYEHPKDPVDVAYSNIVIYTLRVFNEGNMAGYATKVKDDIPEGLEFLPDNSINNAFDWKMYKEDGTETKDVKEAKYIETDFLSKEKEQEEGRNLIKAFDVKTMEIPDSKDLKVAFKVIQPNTSSNIIINKAQISEDSDENGKPVDDVDSKPNEWNEGEDDQDIEKIKVKYFDLSLKKWVAESIVTCDGKTKVTQSGHTGDENPEPPMKEEIQTGKIKSTTVKFKYKIKVTNEGEIAGYATELIDYIPEGLKFEQKDNPDWKVEDNKVITDQLKDTLLEPGDSATVEIILTWINGKNNMGEKVNWAEINKDKNEEESPDIDSTPGNDVKGEDDIDRAPVLLSPATGNAPTYTILALSCITVIAAGVFLIKKFVF